jgi:hypothetical protein
MAYVPVELRQWAIRHHVGADALDELSGLLGAIAAPATAPGGSEARIQSQVRLAAPSVGIRLFRNNVGVLKDDRGVPVRYGLANDSPALNKRLKSSDLIGWRRLPITGNMVGCVVAQFVALECKRPGWSFAPGDEREEAQRRWLELVLADGGYAKFVTEPAQLNG